MSFIVSRNLALKKPSTSKARAGAFAGKVFSLLLVALAHADETGLLQDDECEGAAEGWGLAAGRLQAVSWVAVEELKLSHHNMEIW